MRIVQGVVGDSACLEGEEREGQRERENDCKAGMKQQEWTSVLRRREREIRRIKTSK